jgi:catechol 2,3-dioxygenase-like lactoylglutathione lyase family enzyme
MDKGLSVKFRCVLSAGMFVIGSVVAPGFDPSARSLAQSAFHSPTPIKFDHALICVSDLAPMQQGLADVGLQPDYGGHHGHATTQMAQLGFPDGTYIGVEAPVDASVETGTPQSSLMKANAGPCGWSVTSSDLKTDLERISRLGVTVGVPEPRSRNRPDGTMAEWRSASLGPGAPGSNLPFLIEDKTPRSSRAPHASPSTVGTTLSGVGVVVLSVKNLDENIALFRKVYGWPAPKVEDHPEFGAKIAYFSGTPVMLAAPSTPNSWVSERIGRLGQCPIAFLIHASDFKAASEHFSLPTGRRWFNLHVSWFDVEKLHGVRLGIVGG